MAEPHHGPSGAAGAPAWRHAALSLLVAGGLLALLAQAAGGLGGAVAGLVLGVVALHLVAGGLLVALLVAAARGAHGGAIHWARFYDPLALLLTLGRAGRMREATADLASIRPGEAVLDVGCGTGEVTLRAKARTGPAGRVSGIDLAPEMVAVARRKADRRGLEIDYRVAAVEALPFPDASFDAVLSSLMMHHVPDHLKPAAFGEIHRVLKPGGRLLVVDLERPTGRGHGPVPALLLHARMRQGVQDLPVLVGAAGFAAVEAGTTGFPGLGFVRARVPSPPAAPGGAAGASEEAPAGRPGP